MENAISVSQVNNYIKSIFDAEYMLQNIFVYGEISSYKITNGIAYFNLKDENSLISCVLFGANNFPMYEIGDQVVVRGSVGYYAKGGKLNFNAVSIERFGVGVLYQKFLELKAELESLGYFDETRKKKIPARVKRIGVVTSETGAVIRDIIDVTTRRNDMIDIVLYPVKVQGIGAEKEIASGIEFFSSYDKVDVVIVARGGGSLEDLQPYNTKTVADATFNCKKPLVSAVGHETDYTIIDFVSDLRAPTPSAAAELVVNLKSEDIEACTNLSYYISDMVSKKILDRFNKIIDFKKDMDNAFELNIKDKIAFARKSLNEMERKVLEKLNQSISMVMDIKAKVNTNDIKSILEKGYAKVYNNGRFIKSVSDIDVNSDIQVEFIDGKMSAKVINKETK